MSSASFGIEPQQQISNVTFHCGETNSINVISDTYDLAMAHFLWHVKIAKTALLTVHQNASRLCAQMLKTIDV